MIFRRRAAAIAVVAAVSSAFWTMAAAPAGAATGATSGTTAASSRPAGTEAAVTPGAYRIRNVKVPGYCLQRQPGPKVEDGPLVGMMSCSSSDNQLWDVVDTVNPNFQLVRSRTGGCLDADVQRGRATFVVHVIPCWGTLNPNQMWSLPPLGRTTGISPRAYSPSYVLDNSMDDDGGFGFRVNYWPVNGTVAQLFSMESMG